MALVIVVENGAIVDGANSYISLDDFKGWASDNDYDMAGISDEKVSVGIVRAADFINGLNFIGKPAMPFRAMAWPRTDIGFDNKIPEQTIQAQCWLAANSLTAPDFELFPTAENNANIKRKRETTGPITEETEFFESAKWSGDITDTRFSYVYKLLYDFLKPESDIKTIGLMF